MRTFQLFIFDKRYTVPSLAIVTVTDAERAFEMANKRLNESANHIAVEVHEGDEMLWRIEHD